MRWENDYLKTRCAQLEGDVGDISSQLDRVTQQLERTAARWVTGAANPLGGGR